MTKDEIRELVKDRLQQMGGPYREQHRIRVAPAIADIIFRHKGALDDKVILSYYALNDEIDVSIFMELALFSKAQLLLPRMKNDMIEARKVENLTDDLVKQNEILVPRKQCALVNPINIDVIIVPGRAFGKDGSRVGRGGGHYDRFLARATNALKIGVAFNEQIFDTVPQDKHDIQVDFIVTPTTIFKWNL